MVDQNNELSEGERIIYQTKLHWVLFLGPAMLIILGGYGSQRRDRQPLF